MRYKVVQSNLITHTFKCILEKGISNICLAASHVITINIKYSTAELDFVNWRFLLIVLDW